MRLFGERIDDLHGSDGPTVEHCNEILVVGGRQFQLIGPVSFGKCLRSRPSCRVQAETPLILGVQISRASSLQSRTDPSAQAMALTRSCRVRHARVGPLVQQPPPAGAHRQTSRRPMPKPPTMQAWRNPPSSPPDSESIASEKVGTVQFLLMPFRIKSIWASRKSSSGTG